MDVVLKYFYEIDKEGEYPGLEAKIIVIGESKAGKTSLCKRLLEGKNAELPKEAERTEGIDVTVSKWNTVQSEDPKWNLNIFDFGGQDFYKPLHQFFYTSEALYILVVKDGHLPNDIDYWLEAAHIYGEGSPVLVVNNYFGPVPDKTKNDITQRKLGTVVKEIIKVNLSSCEGLDTLFDTIRRMVNELQIVHQKFLRHGEVAGKIWH
ncbi:MAG: hypothetical protein IPN76_18645 [Saprospiraceae bacterium]|nr:hypothetical protein [Saprospiraceae bacterium]